MTASRRLQFASRSHATPQRQPPCRSGFGPWASAAQLSVRVRRSESHFTREASAKERGRPCDNPSVRRELFEWKPAAPRDQLARWSDDAVLAAVASAYQECVHSQYAVTHRPDERNRSTREVDGVLEAPGALPVAIEITALESFGGQLLDDSRVEKLLSAFQMDLASELPAGLWCIIPVHSFQPGVDWIDARTRLASFLRQEASRLVAGSSIHEVPGIPFRVKLQYDPRLNVPFRIFRAAPPADQITADLVMSMEKALSHKKARLAEYKANGYRTVTVIDGADSALVSWTEPYRAFLAAEKTIGTEHASDVLFAMTGDHNRIYCMAFKGDLALRQALNPVNLKFGPEHAHIWEKDEN